jgi:hypothetical protein
MTEGMTPLQQHYQQLPPENDDIRREPLSHRLRRYRDLWRTRPRRHGWQQAPGGGSSLSRMMSAARAVEAHRVRAPIAHPGHLRTPAVRAPVHMPSPAVRAPRPRLRLRLPGRR